MLSLAFAVFGLFAVVAACLIRSYRFNCSEVRRLISLHAANRLRGDSYLTDEEIRKRCFDHWIFERIFGCTFAVGRWFGNCFTPAVVLEWTGRCKPRYSKLTNRWCYPAWARLTLRTRGHLETVIYWRGGFRFDWNSQHVACWWGKWHHQDCNSPSVPTHAQYRGWLGSHTYV